MEQHQRHFSVSEANALRPWVADRVQRLRRLRGESDLLDTEPIAPQAVATGGVWLGRRHAEVTLRLQLTLEELRLADIVVRDLERGLVDFPALRDGEEVYLCWLVGEPAVTHWHGVESGFASRRPL